MSSRAQKGHDCGLSAGRSVKGPQRLGRGGGGCVSSDYVRAKAAVSPACREPPLHAQEESETFSKSGSGLQHVMKLMCDVSSLSRVSGTRRRTTGHPLTRVQTGPNQGRGLPNQLSPRPFVAFS